MTDQNVPGPDEPGWAAPEPSPPSPPAPAAPPVAPPPPAPPPSAAWDRPASPGPPPTGHRPKRRRAWIFVLVGVLVAIVAAAIVGTALFVANTLPPLEAASDFVNDLADADFRAAADRLCAADRNDPQRALSTVTRHFPGSESISVNPLTVDRDGAQATVDYTVTPRGEGIGHSYELPLVEEQGDWKPCPSAAGSVTDGTLR